MKKALLIFMTLMLCASISTAQHSNEGKSSPTPSPTTAAQSNQGDARVRNVLTQLRDKFIVDSDNDFKLVRDTSDGRTQVAWVLSNTNTYGSMEIREIISPAFKTGGSLSSSLALRLLRENNKYKLGAWRLVGEGDNQAIFYAVQITANADAQTVNAAIKSATLIADAMEKEIVGTDDF